MNVYLILTWVLSIAFSLYMITQTSAAGTSPAGRTARRGVIFWGFFPVIGIQILVQIYYYVRFRQNISANASLDGVQASFGSAQLGVSDAADPMISQPTQQSQQTTNPFL